MYCLYHALRLLPAALVLMGGVLLGMMVRPAQASEEAAFCDTTRQSGSPQEEESFHARRFWPVMGGAFAVDVGVMYGLSELWYSEKGGQFKWYSDRLQDRYPSFEGDGWLDDWHTYVQQDKGGHLFVAWQLARVFGEYGRWTGMSRRHAGLFGGAVSAFFQSQIEIFDGFALEYGASRTDIMANMIGGALGGLQVAYPERLGWFTAKYSYHPSPYYDESISNPVLGYVGNALKDYDGISYWLVVRPERLLHRPARRVWPDWLAVSMGYSGDGLGHPISGVNGTPEHRRQLYLSLDVDVLSTNDWPQPYKALAGFFSFVRLPMPALQLTPDLRWHWLYY